MLQQPRVEIFNKIDGNLFLMSQQGHVVYEGAARDVVPYLTSIGFMKPSRETAPADFCVDVLNGLADRAEGGVTQLGVDVASPRTPTSPESKATAAALTRRRRGSDSKYDLNDSWQRHLVARNSVENGRQQQKENVFSPNESINAPPPPPPSTLLPADSVTETSSEPAPTHWEAFRRFAFLSFLNGQRLLVIRLRNTSSLAVYFLINFVMAVALSSGFSIYMQDSYLGVLSPPTRPELQGFFPSPLHDYTGIS